MRTRPQIRLLYFFLLILVIGCSRSVPEYKSTDISQVDWDTSFSLVSHTGEKTTLKKFHGRVAAIFFGYTHCPHICSPTLARLAEVRKLLGDQAGQLQILFISVDPVYDTPQRLAEFLPKFDSTFIGLTGKEQEIKTVMNNFKLFSELQISKGKERIIAHSGGIFVVGKRGKLRLYMKEGMSIDDMKHDMKLLVSE